MKLELVANDTYFKSARIGHWSNETGYWGVEVLATSDAYWKWTKHLRIQSDFTEEWQIEPFQMAVKRGLRVMKEWDPEREEAEIPDV